MMRSKRWLIFNALGYQLSWIAAMVFAGRGLEWFSVLSVGLFLFLHFSFTRRVVLDLLVLLGFVLVGFGVEYLNVALGVLVFEWHYFDVLGVPVWLLSVWMSFSVLFGVALRWLYGRYLLAGFLGAVFGPLSYWSGVRLGVANFPDFWMSMGGLAVVWGVLMSVGVVVLKEVYLD